ncbi:hypothetical protein UlMin_022238 [Ulmus minor]
MQDFSKACLEKDMEFEVSGVKNFGQSLQELRSLRSQLHHAADYCEASFLNAKEKKDVVDSTKEYICRAVITVVDHLGCVSDNLNSLISENKAFSDTELRINILKQKLLLSEQYTHKLALTRYQWNAIKPRYNPRYLSAPSKDAEKSDDDGRDFRKVSSKKVIEKHVAFEREDNMPLFVYAFSGKPAVLSNEEAKSSLVLPVRNGFSILSKAPNPAFHFQEITRKNRRSRKSLHGSDIMSLIRRTRRTA